MRAIVVTADQRSSRSSPDAVPEVLELLRRHATLRPFQRTAGDEVQGVLDAAGSVAPVLETLLRDGRWHVGLGLGLVEAPLPPSAREGRGPAFVAAREAVTTARTAPWHLRVAGEGAVPRNLESTSWLWAAVLGRRTEKGWQVVDLVDQGLSYEGAGEHLGISQSAVSQRAAAAGLVEGRRARELVAAWTQQWLDGGEA
jgi:hypothetical protein